jgi:hypothetical protein
MMEGTVFKNKALVTAVNPYDFDNDQKERVSGVTMEFLMTDNLHPCGEGEAKGIKIIKDSVMYDKKRPFHFCSRHVRTQFQDDAGKQKR